MSLKPEDIIARLEPIDALIEDFFKNLLLGKNKFLIELKKRIEAWIKKCRNGDEISDLTETVLENFINQANQTLLEHLNTEAGYCQLNWSTVKPTPAALNIQWVTKKLAEFIRLITPEIPRTESPPKKTPFALVFDRDDLSQLQNPLLNYELQRMERLLEKTIEIHDELATKEISFKKPPTENAISKALSNLQIKYQNETNEAQEIKTEIRRRIRAHNSDLNDEGLIKRGRSVSLAIEIIEKCNIGREKISKQIDAIYPQTEDELQLKTMQQTGMHCLENKLKTLLLSFIQIQVQKDNPEMQFLTKQLLEFVNSITDALTAGKYPLADIDNVKLVKKLLFHHLRQSTDRLDFNVTCLALEAVSTYTLSLTEADLTQIPLLPNALIVKIEKDTSLLSRLKANENYVLKYAVLDPSQKRKIETITSTDLPCLSTLNPATTLDELTLHLPEILDFTAAQNNTKYSIEALLKKLFQSTADEKISLLNNVFSKLKKDAVENNIPILKEKIAQITYALKKMDEFPLDKIATCFSIQEKLTRERNNINSNNSVIAELLLQLQKKITDFLERIASDASPIPAKGFNTDLTAKALERCNQLRTLQNKLSDMQRVFESDLNVKKTISEIKSLEQITQLHQATEAILHKQNKLQTELQTIQNSLNEKEISSLLHNITTFYHNKINEFQAKLNKAINEAEAALLFENNLKIPSPDILDKLHLPQEFVTQLSVRKDSLALIQEEVTQQLDTLNAHLVRIRDKVLEEIKPKQDALTNAIKRGHSRKQILDNADIKNPFRMNLVDATEKSQTLFNQYQSHIQNLDSTAGTKLAKWYRDHLEYRSQVDTQLQLRDTLSESVAEIESRLTSDCYKKAEELLLEIQKEYVRIFIKYIPSNKTKKLSEQEISELEKNCMSLLISPNSTHDFKTIDLKSIKIILDSVDPRLNKLIAIYSDFKETHERYISKNPTNRTLPYSLTDKAYCAALISKINTHLLSPRMETISDGINNQFFQWIRRKLLKPLETFFHNLFHKKPIRFFTAGACITEKNLIKIGNDYYPQFTP